MGLRSFDLRHRPSDRRASVKPCRRVPARSYLLFPGKIVDAFYIDSSWWPNCIIHDIRFQRFFNIFPIWFETLVGISITRPILICHFLTVSCFCWAIMLGHRVHSLLLRYAVCKQILMYYFQFEKQLQQIKHGEKVVIFPRHWSQLTPSWPPRKVCVCVCVRDKQHWHLCGRMWHGSVSSAVHVLLGRTT